MILLVSRGDVSVKCIWKEAKRYTIEWRKLGELMWSYVSFRKRPIIVLA